MGKELKYEQKERKAKLISTSNNRNDMMEYISESYKLYAEAKF